MKTKLISCLFVLFSIPLFSQEDYTPSGKAFATIFANFHQGISGTNEAAFELVRGYIGYEYNFSPEFYAKINVDVGSPNDLSPYSKLRRYAYFKNAYLRYSQNKLQIEFGLISLKQFKLQEKIWERRYLMKTLADEYKLGSSADLGVNFHYKFNDYVDADFTIMNGEGYNSVQMDDVFKYGVGSTFTFPKNFTSRVFYDFTYNEINESTLLLFTSYDYKKKWNIAGEFIFRKNDGWEENRDIFGLSVFGKYNITSQYQLFARFDKISSNRINGETNPWNLADDGTALVAGIQFNPIKNIKMALNYHDWYPRAANMEGQAFIFLDLEVKM
ncbi:porin [Maribellus maritimus]|uniref:porin n=1 Tax=Maribellus maritimus TaxID=2870838 RepID=UPI001EEA2A1A|nr:porin [Maribellus maritimus]MCG6189659.1 porin [Maribellus maritimus]